ncbi:hypothetical protein [Bradyrhizobium japonicum]|uniref:hypothetical protein n=1 Tax=Bradyrhizobium japonicum TaxID=375 RepID=UPI003B6811B4
MVEEAGFVALEAVTRPTRSPLTGGHFTLLFADINMPWEHGRAELAHTMRNLPNSDRQAPHPPMLDHP